MKKILLLISSCLFIITSVSAQVTGSLDALTDVSCAGNCDGSATVSATTGSAPFMYQWDAGAGSQTTSTATGLCAGSYNVTITDNTLATDVVNVVITEPSPVMATLNVSTDVTCFGNCDGSAEVIPSGGVGGYIFQWDDPGFQITAMASGLCSGTFNVTVTDLNGCFAQEFVIINEPAMLVVDAGIDVSICEGGSIPVGGSPTAIGGASPYAYAWDNAGSLDNPTLSNPNAMPMTTTNFSVTVTDAMGCQSSDFVLVTVDPIPVANAGSDQTVCASAGMVNLNGSYLNSTGVMWSTDGSGAFTPSPTDPNATYAFSGADIAAGIVTLSMTTTGGGVCSSIMDNLIVTINSDPVVDAGFDATICSGSSVALGGTPTASGGAGGYTYIWDNSPLLSDPNVANPDAMPTSSTNFTVMVTDLAGCQSSDMVLVTVNAAISVSMSSTNVQCNGICNGTADAFTSGGISPYSFTWDGSTGGQTTQTATGLCAGAYNVTVSDMSGCTSTSGVVITEPPALSGALTVTDVHCYGWSSGAADMVASGGTPPYTYLWSHGPTTASVSNITAASYTVTVTDGAGCQYSDVAVINQPIYITVSGTVTDVSTYGGTDGAIDAVVSGGTPAYTYNWSNAMVTEDLTGISAGTYTLTVTDANTCTLIYSFNVNQPACSMTANIFAYANAGCNGSCDGNAEVAVTGGTAPFTYIWDDPLAQTGLQANALCAGTYNVTVTDNVGCNATTSAVISEPTALEVSATTTDVSVPAGNDGAINVTVIGGTTPYSYSWASSQISEDLTGISAGTYDLTVTDAIGCTSTGSWLINEPGCSMTAEISSFTDITCFGACDGTATVSPIGGTLPFTYLWDNAQTIDVVSSLCAGNYNVTVTDNSGCQATAVATITEPPVLSVSAVTSDVTTIAGADGAVDVTVSGGLPMYSYLWSTAEITEDLTGLSAGTYEITVTDANGCFVVGNWVVNEPTCTMTAIISASTNVSCNGACDGTATVSPASGTAPYIYIWDDPGAQTTATATSLCTGMFNVTITDNSGCQASAFVDITEPMPLAVGASIINASYFGGNDGSIMLNVTGGSPPYVYDWAAGGTLPALTGLVAGTYTITVSDMNVCNLVKTYIVNEPEDDGCDIVPSFTFTVGGNTLDLSFSNTSSGTFDTYFWTFGDYSSAETIANPTHLFSEGDYYNVSLTVINTANGCEATVTQPILVVDPVVESCSADFDAYIDNDGMTVTFQDESAASAGIGSWSWDFGNGTSSNLQHPVVTYITPGSKTVKLTITDLAGTCSDIYTKTIQIGIAPCTINANFTATVSGLTAAFFNNSTGATGATFEWDFDDGFTSTLTNPTHTYFASGNYEVKLTVTGAGGVCINQKETFVTVGSNLPPIVEIINNTTDILAGSYVNLYADVLNYTSTQEAGLEYFWMLGDGSIYDTHDVINHHFPVGGTYNVVLVVTDPNTGLVGFAQSEVLVMGGDDISNVGFVHSGAPGTVLFEAFDAISGADLYPFEYSWNFGDGSVIEYGQSISHNFAADGIYNVCLTATNSAGVSKMVCQNVVINSDPMTAPCVAVITYTVIPADYIVKFWSTESTGNPADYEFVWDFGDGNTSILQNPVHTYGAPDYYLVSLTITNTITGCSHTTVALVNAGAGSNGIQGHFTSVQNGNGGLKANEYSVDFTGAAFGEPASYFWDFGDGTDGDSTTITPTHDYAGVGTYNVCLTVSDPFSGQEDTYCDDVVVTDPLGRNIIENIIVKDVCPNPFRNEIRISLNSETVHVVNVELTDMLGKVILTEEYQGRNGQQSIVLNGFNSEISEGIYYLKITAGSSVSVHKMIHK